MILPRFKALFPIFSFVSLGSGKFAPAALVCTLEESGISLSSGWRAGANSSRFGTNLSRAGANSSPAGSTYARNITINNMIREKWKKWQRIKKLFKLLEQYKNSHICCESSQQLWRLFCKTCLLKHHNWTVLFFRLHCVTAWNNIFGLNKLLQHSLNLPSFCIFWSVL